VILPDVFFNPELSLLAFQRRVLALAEDPAVPLLERLRFLGIVTSNIDEFFMVRIAKLRDAARADLADPAAAIRHDGFTRLQLLSAVEAEVASLMRAMARCADLCLHDAARHGTYLASWAALSVRERDALSEQYRRDIHPDLLPLAITMSPGVPLPHLPHLGLFIGVVYRQPGETRTRLAEHELPADLPRLLPVPGRARTVIPVEEVLRANVQLLYPTAHVEETYLFRVTRGGDLHLDDEQADDLIEAVHIATAQRPQNPAVRVEVEARMPERVRALILDNLQRDASGRSMESTVSAVDAVDGLLDLRCLQSLPLPSDAALEFPPMQPRDVFRDAHSVFDAISAGDVLVHHPFDDFEASVVRFVRDAAADPDVTSIDITLYRVGTPSPIVDALVSAARNGKRVFALVELQARFDEAHNVQSARALERAGGRVVSGLPGLKVHAKVALVTRTEGHRTVRYAHVGTGNYNTRSGRQYTDFSLFSARAALVDDVADLFRALAHSATPHGATHGAALIAPEQLLPALLSRIERETAHARAGHAASIRIKINALADREVVAALYAASQAGVQVALVVRGICTLRPGVVGLSERVRVVSVVGRFLEHSRCYRFENAGDPEYFIGSSDLRPRNLRRRVEVLVGVSDRRHRAMLDEVFAAYFGDATAWELTADGAYQKREGDALGAQAVMAQGWSARAR
jgi:polyphosphate kinase